MQLPSPRIPSVLIFTLQQATELVDFVCPKPITEAPNPHSKECLRRKALDGFWSQDTKSKFRLRLQVLSPGRGPCLKTRDLKALNPWCRSHLFCPNSVSCRAPCLPCASCESQKSLKPWTLTILWFPLNPKPLHIAWSHACLVRVCESKPLYTSQGKTAQDQALPGLEEKFKVAALMLPSWDL